jgi:hypothetical protein
MNEAAHANKKILRVISEHAQRLDDGSAILSLRAWCASEADAKAVQAEVVEAMRQRFAGKHLIVIPSMPEAVKKAA